MRYSANKPAEALYREQQVFDATTQKSAADSEENILE